MLLTPSDYWGLIWPVFWLLVLLVIAHLIVLVSSPPLGFLFIAFTFIAIIQIGGISDASINNDYIISEILSSYKKNHTSFHTTVMIQLNEAEHDRLIGRALRTKCFIISVRHHDNPKRANTLVIEWEREQPLLSHCKVK